MKRNFAIKMAIKIILLLLIAIAICGCHNVNNTYNSSKPDKPTSVQSIIDFNQYLRRVWIAKKNLGADEAYELPSFYITAIDNDKISGKFSPNRMVIPDMDFYDNDDWRFGTFLGTITNEIAECEFQWEYAGIEGTMKITFMSNDEIKAVIRYYSKDELYDDTVHDGTFLLSPYNLETDKADEDEFTTDTSYPVDLAYWGKVNFVTRDMTGGKRNVLAILLTNSIGDKVKNKATLVKMGARNKGP